MNYKVGDLVRVRPINYLLDKYKWHYDKTRAKFYLDTPSKFTRNMLIYCGKEGVVVRNIGNVFYKISFDGRICDFCFDNETIYQDKSNYHQIRGLNEGKLAELLRDVSKGGEHSIIEWYDWLHSDRKVSDI